ncbi:MAG: BREX-1 system phosphatase PglZ type A [Desulfobacterales bacterium CG23_combo_of_CG06-09_8_20_14_all_51_8]|nr:MAG: BREX-1 system phosphatase PglZ type A [Desulfobacterales bacterium CG23_combo_of_CG06-09_8_20_14_all_51_8]
MDIKQISDALNRIFTEKNKRIIFWYDGEKEFEDILPSLTVNDAVVLRMDGNSALELKIRLEFDDTKGRYVLYAPWHEPPPEEDWLFDIRLYSHTFLADSASIIMKELDLPHQSLRPYIQKRKAFFNSQDRLNRLKKWIAPEDREDDMDLKMLAVMVRADQPEPFAILMKLFDSFCRDGEVDMETSSRPWLDIEKLDLSGFFWKLMARTFGYAHPEAATLNDFLLRVFVTDFAGTLKADPPSSVSHFRMGDAKTAMNASVFLSQWRSNTLYFANYNTISRFVGGRLKIDESLSSFDITALEEVMTFAAVERRIISAIRDRLMNPPENGFLAMRETIKRRLDGYWATTALEDGVFGNLYRTTYHAMLAAIDLFDLRKKYDAGFSYPSAQAMFTAYARELFLFDQLYRKFHELSDKADLAGWDVLKTLREKVEDCYSNWFMMQMSLKWGDFLAAEHSDALMKNWRIPGVTNQYGFFDKYVKPTVKGSARNRLFVIISDAFRFEAAEELTRIINGKYRLKADLAPMLGVVPSYTALGMASLLPHKNLSFKPKGDVIVDERPTNSTDLRAEILSSYEGTAIKSDELMVMSKDKGREFVKPHRLIYIFHDQIDAVGDKAASEGNTFEAVRKAIDDLYALVSFIINSLNGANVIITADHGFIYQEKPPEPLDKSKVAHHPENVVKTHKRFILGKQLRGADNVYWGNTAITAHTDVEMEFLLPKGTNRFNFVGGARFYHGGAMLQEVVIPVISVSEMKGIHLEKSEVRAVGVSLLGTCKKLVTSRPVYKFIQTDPVSDRMKALTLKISLRDGNDLISNEETVTFDSVSETLDERQKSVKLSLKAGTYDNKKEYYLVLRNTDETEYERMPITIDIAFASDF